MSGFKLSGMDNLEKALKKGTDLNGVRRIVKGNGANMQEMAMRKAPVDTGTMKRYIMLSVHDEGMTTRIKALANYSSYVEFGTRFQNAQPFIKPSYDKQKTQFKKDLDRLFK